MQRCKPCMHITIVQIMIHMQKCIPIIIYKHEIDLKLYALTFKDEQYIVRCSFFKKINLTIYL